MENSKSILFVDDEQEILEILVDFFKEEGFDLHTATNAEEALDIVDSMNMDFVLSDNKLPDASGEDLLKKIQAASPGTIRVLASGYVDVDFGTIGQDAQDGTLYLSKPWDILTLKQLISERLA